MLPSARPSSASPDTCQPASPPGPEMRSKSTRQRKSGSLSFPYSLLRFMARRLNRSLLLRRSCHILGTCRLLVCLPSRLIGRTKLVFLPAHHVTAFIGPFGSLFTSHSSAIAHVFAAFLGP